MYLYTCIHLYQQSYENILHHLIRLDSQQLTGCKNLFSKVSEGDNNPNASLFMGKNNNFYFKLQHSKNLDKAEILSLSNINYKTPNSSESFKSLLKEYLTTALPSSPLFSTPF